MDILSEKDNKLLGRREIWAQIEHTGKSTPTRNELWDAVTVKLKAPKETVVVDKIMGVPKTQTSKVKVFIYGSKEAVPQRKADKMAGIKKGKKAAPAEKK